MSNNRKKNALQSSLDKEISIRKKKRSSRIKTRTNKTRNNGVRKDFQVSFFDEIKLIIIILVVSVTLLSSVGLILYSLRSVSGYGMMPTLRDKDLVINQRFNTSYHRFDLVLFDRGGEKEIKRIIGLPGEDIYYMKDTLYVNNLPIDEKFIIDKINENQGKNNNFTTDFSLLELTGLSKIPESYFLVLGDNRPYTTDSRDYGLVEQKKVGGKVKIRLFPFETAIRF